MTTRHRKSTYALALVISLLTYAEPSLAQTVGQSAVACHEIKFSDAKYNNAEPSIERLFSLAAYYINSTARQIVANYKLNSSCGNKYAARYSPKYDGLVFIGTYIVNGIVSADEELRHGTTARCPITPAHYALALSTVVFLERRDDAKSRQLASKVARDFQAKVRASNCKDEESGIKIRWQSYYNKTY